MTHQNQISEETVVSRKVDALLRWYQFICWVVVVRFVLLWMFPNKSLGFFTNQGVGDGSFSDIAIPFIIVFFVFLERAFSKARQHDSHRDLYLSLSQRALFFVSILMIGMGKLSWEWYSGVWSGSFLFLFWAILAYYVRVEGDTIELMKIHYIEPRMLEEGSMTLEKMSRASNEELFLVFENGKKPLESQLAGFEFCGYNRPWWASVAGIRKFKKGFFYAPESKQLEGYNIPVFQNSLHGEWLALPEDDAPKRFGYYFVSTPFAGSRDDLHPNSLLLNYGTSHRNKPYEPPRLLRDYLVQPDPSNADLFLGKAYLNLLGFRMFTNFFILQRHRPSDYQGDE